jgi:hypothetical protein
MSRRHVAGPHCRRAAARYPKPRAKQHFGRSIEQVTLSRNSADAQLGAARAVMRSIQTECVNVGEILRFHSDAARFVPPAVRVPYTKYTCSFILTTRVRLLRLAC